ncbi:MAG: mucoidy inhibitor MuiA family protein [Rikenella sp.]|nr:mucoidy inhibitor MuiA family protein [Rikenella sp.]
MKRFVYCLSVAALAWSGAAAAPESLNVEVKEVRVYPHGVYLTLSVPASLKGGADETVVFPDLWYADPATVELKLLPSAAGVDYVVESQRAEKGSDVRLQQVYLQCQDTLLARKARLEADSMVLVRKAEFLASNARQEGSALSQLAAAEQWMREQYTQTYEAQRRNREALAELGKKIADNASRIRLVNARANRVTLVRARVNSPEAQQVVFELSYFADAAQWEPVYFFRFEPGGTTAEIDYRATVRQWSGFAWDRVPAVLNYGAPRSSLYRPKLSKTYVSYRKPVAERLERNTLMTFSASYAGGEKLQILDADESQEMAFDPDLPAAGVELSEIGVGYRLGRPLTLASSSDNRQIRQTVELRKDTVPVVYEYEVTPKVAPWVLLLARVPDWQKLHLTDGRINVFCAGRMLGQSTLSVRSTQDTLEVPLMYEPQVVVDRTEVGNYRERVSGSKTERSQRYEIRIKNNKDFPVNLTVRDQYPVSDTDEVEVVLADASGAQVDAESGMLTWRLRLAPGEEQVLTFSYSVRYPKGGTVQW